MLWTVYNLQTWLHKYSTEHDKCHKKSTCWSMYMYIYANVKLGHHKLIFLHSSLYSWTWTIADIRSLVCHQPIVSFFYLCSLMSAVNAAQSIITTVHNEWARISLIISEMKLMIFYMSSKENFEQMCTCYTCLELNIHDKTHSQSRKTSFFTKV